MIRSRRLHGAALASATALLCCIAGANCPSTPGSGAPGDGSEAPDGNGATVSFANDVQPIFDAHCTECHSAGSDQVAVGATQLLLSPGVSYGSLVNQLITVPQSNALLVDPDDSASSQLYCKVSDACLRVGQIMPLNRPPLSSEQVSLIGTWIDEGAQNN